MSNAVSIFLPQRAAHFGSLACETLLCSHVRAFATGKIGASELAELFQNLGHPLTYERLVEIMRKYDVDHSGQIEFGEFLRMFQTELLDLQEVMDYIMGDAREREASSSRAAGVC